MINFTKCVSSKLPQRLKIKLDFEPKTSPRLLYAIYLPNELPNDSLHK